MRKLENRELPRKSIEEFKSSEKKPVILILEDVRSLHNIGSVFRTADAFLIEKIYLCGITAIPPNKEIQKTALGATETVTWEYAKSCTDLISKLKTENIAVWAIEQVENSIYLNDFQLKKNQKYALVFGNEVFGVSQDAVKMCNGTIEIPQLGTKHSLNISVSVGIVVWDFYSKLKSFKFKV